jgi:hypothetical protein
VRRNLFRSLACGLGRKESRVVADDQRVPGLPFIPDVARDGCRNPPDVFKDEIFADDPAPAVSSKLDLLRSLLQCRLPSSSR